MTTTRHPIPPTAWILGVVLPAVIGVAGVALQLVWLPELPDPVAIHWGVADQPDGFASPIATIVMSAVVAIALPALFALMLAGTRRGGFSANHKLLTASSLTVSTLIATMMTASLGMQRGLDDAADAGGIVPWLLWGLGAGLALAVASWFILPRAVSTAIDAVEATPLDLAPGERGVWIAGVQLSAGAIIGIAAAVLGSFAAVIIVTVASEGAAWPILVVPVLLIAASITSVAWRVRVDAFGLTVHARPLGWPAVRIAAADIVRVETVEVEPLSEFGGFGWRWAPGRSFGVIARRGEAIEVERRDGRRFTVTVDGASTGAALLAAYVSPVPLR